MSFKKLVFAIGIAVGTSLAVGAFPPDASAQTIACWYDEAGANRGADSCRQGGNVSPPCDPALGARCEVGAAGQCRDTGGDYSHYIVVDMDDSAGCPATFAAAGGDLYDFEQGRVVIALDQPLSIPSGNSVAYTKTLSTDRYGASFTMTVEYFPGEDYYALQFKTQGLPGMAGEGLGNRGPLMPYSDVWNVRAEPQIIYAAGVGLYDAIEDLQTKFNGSNGRVQFTTAGSVTDGTLVVTMQRE